MDKTYEKKIANQISKISKTKSYTEEEAIDLLAVFIKNKHANVDPLGHSIYKKLNKNDQATIDNVFKVFERRFEFHYKQQISNMRKVAAYVQKFKDSPFLQKAHKLYGIKNQNMPVYIAMSYNANKSAGGMQLGNMVILQFGDYKLNGDNSPMLNVLFHELTNKGSVAKFLPKNLDIQLPRTFTGDIKDFVDEVIHKALWSEIGLLSQKQFGWSNQEVKKSYEFLLENFRSPYKEMIKKAFAAREYLARELIDNPSFKFNRKSTRELLDIISV